MQHIAIDASVTYSIVMHSFRKTNVPV